MTPEQNDLDSIRWTDHHSVGWPAGHGEALELYRDAVVRPSLAALSAKIDELQRQGDVAAEFALIDLEPMHQRTVEGYMLVVQSMFERGLREMLVGRSKAINPKHPGTASLQSAVWRHKTKPDLHAHFRDLMGFPLSVFDSLDDLDLLQLFGNVFRHGDGDSAQRLNERCPSLWINWLAPGMEINAGNFRIKIPDDAPQHPSIRDMTLPAVVLDQMIQSVLWFWQDIEFIRCNSFKNKVPAVVAELDRQRRERPHRASQRAWTPK